MNLFEIWGTTGYTTEINDCFVLVELGEMILTKDWNPFETERFFFERGLNE